MPRLNADITIFPKDEPLDSERPVDFTAEDYDYLSFVNEGTHGIPPLVTKTRDKSTGEDKPPVAGPGERVLYVNPGAMLAMLAEKRDA